MRRGGLGWLATAVIAAVLAAPASAAVFSFSTGSPDGKMAMGSRPAGATQEIEAADDFVTTDPTSISGATFTGLVVPGTGTIQSVQIGIYRVFPNDSDATRTPNVPTRANSPADTDFGVRSTDSGGLTFTASELSGSFFAANSVLNGIHPKPTQTTGGDGPVTGAEYSFAVKFTPPLQLPADHYFLVPQVSTSAGANFYWLSAPRTGAPFPSGATDVQAWIRNAALAPDWLRVGTDIVGGASPPTFNGTFSLSGVTCPPISVSPASLPGATAGQPYSASFTASGGTAPYSFRETGALPGGVGLDPGGSLTGTPAQDGTFPITVTAAAADGCTGSEDVTLTVAPASTAPPITPVTPAVPATSPLPPAISNARLAPKAFRAAPKGATLARRLPIGTTVSYVDSQAAVTTFTVLRPGAGHRRGRKCLAGRARRGQKRCTRWVAAGSASHKDTAGAVKVHFSGRVRRRRLKPGSYELALMPKSSGLTGKTVVLTFRIKR